MDGFEDYSDGGAAFCAGGRRGFSPARDYILVYNATSGGISRTFPVALDPGCIQVRSGGGFCVYDDTSYQLVSGAMRATTERWGVAMENIPANDWGRIQVCGVADVCVLGYVNSAVPAVVPCSGGVCFSDVGSPAAARVLVTHNGRAVIDLQKRWEIAPSYSGYFKLEDASSYDADTGLLISGAIRVINGAYPQDPFCGTTDLPGSGREVSAATLNMSGGFVSLYAWYDSAAGKYAARVDSSRDYASAAGSGCYGEFQLGRVSVESGRLAIVQDWQGGPVYFSVRYIL